MKRVYQLQAELENCDIGFDVEYECLIENSYFSKEEIKKYLETHPVYKGKSTEYLEGKRSFKLIEMEMREKKNISLKTLLPFLRLEIDGKKSEMVDVMYLSGYFSGDLLLSRKAKDYIEKRYGEKNIEFLEIFYEEIPLYIMNVMENEYCANIDFTSIKGREVLDVSKIEKEIFRARASSHPGYVKAAIFCTEECKDYLEASDLKGYQFIEVIDVAEAKRLEQEKKEATEPSFPEIEEKRYYDNGLLEWEGTLWKGFRIKDWKFYHENGTLSMEGEYNRDGEAEGEWKYYHSNGNLKGIGHYAQGKKTGVFQNYEEEKGYLFSEGDYTGKTKEDLIFWRFYYEDGSLQKEGTAREIGNNEDWEITGEWRYYSPSGELIKREVFEKNELIEEE